MPKAAEEYSPGDALRTIIRIAPWTYAFIAFAMGFMIYREVRQNLLSQMVGTVFPLMVGIIGFVVSIMVRPWVMARAAHLDESWKKVHNVQGFTEPPWQDLSDDELRVRLVARDIEPHVAAELVTERDEGRVARTISDFLGFD